MRLIYLNGGSVVSKKIRLTGLTKHKFISKNENGAEIWEGLTKESHVHGWEDGIGEFLWESEENGLVFAWDTSRASA